MAVKAVVRSTVLIRHRLVASVGTSGWVAGERTRGACRQRRGVQTDAGSVYSDTPVANEDVLVSENALRLTLGRLDSCPGI